MNIDQNAILATWIRTALGTFKPLDRKLLNGGASDEATLQLLNALEDAYERSGQKGVQMAWGSLRQDFPAITSRIQRRHAYRGDELSLLQPITYLIQDRLFVGGLHCIYGDSNVGKSVWALEAAERVAAMGLVALYIMGEGANGYRDRHEVWKSVRGINTDPNIYFWNGAFPLIDPAARQEFAVEMLANGVLLPEIEDDGSLLSIARKPALIVIDTLASTYSGDENDAAAMSKYLNSTLPWRLDGCAVLIVHHSNRADTGPRGSGAFKAGIDALFFMQDQDGSRVIKCEKFRDAPLCPTVTRELVGHTVGEYSAATLEAERPANGRITPSQQEVLSILASHTFSEGARATDIKSVTGMNAPQFHAVIEHLLEAGLVRKDGKYDPFLLTDKGRAAIKRLGMTSAAPPITAFLPAGNEPDSDVVF